MKKAFQAIKFQPDTLKIINSAEFIIQEYQDQGYNLTLRQLYYQMVSRLIIDNTERDYKRLSDIISNARLGGLIDWNAIEDRTRNLRGISHWRSPSDIINSARHSMRIDKWKNQPNRIEVWVEKDALVGVLEVVCEEHDVDYFACRGYVSQSEMFAASQRIVNYILDDQEVYIIHLGDHDPSGIDMTRDIQDRMNMFLEGMLVGVDRIALNWDQVQAYKPPPNPAKATDARFESYRKKFGDESWELDALNPATISALIEDKIQELRDVDLWEEMVEKENEYREKLRKVALNWEEISTYVETL